MTSTTSPPAEGRHSTAAFAALALGVALPLLGVTLARESLLPAFAFFSVVVPGGSAWVVWHVPVVGLAIAAMAGWWYSGFANTRPWPTCMWAMTIFVAAYVPSVLASHWQQGVYERLFRSEFTSSVYVAVANAYILTLLTAISAGSVWLAIQTLRGGPIVPALMKNTPGRADLKMLAVAAMLTLALVCIASTAMGGYPVAAAAALATEAAGARYLLTRQTPARRASRQGRVPPAVIDAAVLTGVLGIAFLLRYAWGLHVLATTGSQYVAASDDGLTYHPFASRIARGSYPTLDEAKYWGGMLYWYFLAGIYRMAGVGNFRAVILVQSALGVGIPAATYVIARTAFESRAVAVASALIVALNQGLIFVCGVVGMEALYLPLFYTGLAGLVWLMTCDVRPASACLTVGMLFGLANASRAEVIGYPLILFGLAALAAVHSRRLRGSSAVRASDVRLTFLVLAGFGLIWLGQGLFNIALYGTFSLHSTQAAVTYGLTYFDISENANLVLMGFDPFRNVTHSISVFWHYPKVVGSYLVVGFVKRFYTFFMMPSDGLFDPLMLTRTGWIYQFFPAIRVSFSSIIETASPIFAVIGMATLFTLRRQLVGRALFVWMAYATFLNAFICVKSPRHRAVLIPILVMCMARGVQVLLQRVYVVRESVRSTEPV